MPKVANQVLALLILLALAFGAGYLFASRSTDDELLRDLERTRTELKNANDRVRELQDIGDSLRAELGRARSYDLELEEQSQRDRQSIGELSRNIDVIERLAQRDGELLEQLYRFSPEANPP